ncbi:MAG: alpha/beta hydrolase [Pseudomonadota bacterium]
MTATLAERLSAEHRRGLDRVRRAARFLLAARDRSLPELAEIRNFHFEGAAGPLPARLYAPHGAETPGPLLVYFHGGGFVLSDLDTHDALCARLAHAGKIRVVSCRYRLAPEAPFPAQRDDALAAARWMREHAGRLGADPERLALGGDSAGGYLAVATAARLNAERPGTVRAQVLIYPLLTLEDDAWASSVLHDTRIVGRLAVIYIRAQLARAHAPSLLATFPGSAPPTVLMAGGALDPCRPDARDYAALLAGAGVACEERYYEGQMHGFANLTHVSAVAREAVAETGRLAGRLLRD